MREYRDIKEEESTMQLLSEIHDKVKSHPYRETNDETFKRDYQDLLFDLSHIAWCEVYKYCKSKGIENGTGMFHDFNGAILSIGNLNCLQHVERCLMVIHRFINTGIWDEYWTYYTGCNIEKGMNRVRQYVLDPEINKFEGVYTTPELKIVIQSLDEEIKSYVEHAEKEREEDGFYHRFAKYFVERRKYFVERKRKQEENEARVRLE